MAPLPQKLGGTGATSLPPGSSYTLPAASANALGGVKSASAPSNQFQTGIDTTGAPTFAQPAILNVSGLQSALDAKAPLASPTFTGTATAAALNVTGTLNAASASVAGAATAQTLTVSGATSLGAVTATGTASLASVTTTGNVGVGGTLSVTGGGASISGGVSAASLSATGNASFGGTLTVTGKTTLNDVLTVNSGISASGGSLIGGAYLHDGTVDFQSAAPNFITGASKAPSSNYIRVFAGGQAAFIQLAY